MNIIESIAVGGITMIIAETLETPQSSFDLAQQ
jgi:hypothetical protein